MDDSGHRSIHVLRGTALISGSSGGSRLTVGAGGNVMTATDGREERRSTTSRSQMIAKSIQKVYFRKVRIGSP